MALPGKGEHQKVGGLAGLGKVLNSWAWIRRILSPAEYAQKYFMQVADFQVVGHSDHSDNPCHHGTDII